MERGVEDAKGIPVCWSGLDGGTGSTPTPPLASMQPQTHDAGARTHAHPTRARALTPAGAHTHQTPITPYNTQRANGRKEGLRRSSSRLGVWITPIAKYRRSRTNVPNEKHNNDVTTRKQRPDDGQHEATRQKRGARREAHCGMGRCETASANRFRKRETPDVISSLRSFCVNKMRSNSLSLPAGRGGAHRPQMFLDSFPLVKSLGPQCHRMPQPPAPLRECIEWHGAWSQRHSHTAAWPSLSRSWN